MIPSETRDLLSAAVTAQPYPLLFVTVSGAHLYGFASPDSDFDLRGIHALPAAEVVGLETGPETIRVTEDREGREIDLVTHDGKKFVTLMLKKNGYVLEQLLSPIAVQTSPRHDEMIALATQCLTRHHAHHYLGFAQTEWKLFEKTQPRRVKPLLYVYRVLLTGIHLMQSGQVEASLVRLNATERLAFLDDLIALKTHGNENEPLSIGSFEFHEREYRRLLAKLEDAYRASTLPETATARPALHDFLVRVRLDHLHE